MRVTGGLLKGRAIGTGDARRARYTPSRVREALFDYLGDVEGCRVLDLYAGAGTFAVEALSRGASLAVCVERDRKMAALITRNLEALDLADRSEVLHMEVERAVPFLAQRITRYDIIFADPPYEKGMVSTTLSLVQANGIADEEGLIIMEHSKRERPDPMSLKGWEKVSERRYGDAEITVLAPRKRVERSPQ